MEEISKQAFVYIFADENKSIDVRINLCILDYYINKNSLLHKNSLPLHCLNRQDVFTNS